MKLTINGKEEISGLIFKKTDYYLEITLETLPEEYDLIKKHNW